MTISDILEEAKKLSSEERETLAQALIAMNRWSDDELDDLLTVEPLTGAEIVAQGLTGTWNELDIDNGAEWVNVQRRKRQARRKW